MFGALIASLEIVSDFKRYVDTNKILYVCQHELLLHV